MDIQYTSVCMGWNGHTGVHVQASTSLPMDSIFLVRAQIRHPSPILSRKSRAVVTFGPTVREAVEGDGSSEGDEGRGVRSADGLGLPVLDGCWDVSECKWDTWKT